MPDRLNRAERTSGKIDSTDNILSNIQSTTLSTMPGPRGASGAAKSVPALAYVYTVNVVEEDKVNRPAAFPTIAKAIRYIHQIPRAVAQEGIHNEDNPIKRGTFENSALERYWINTLDETEYDSLDMYNRRWKKFLRVVVRDAEEELDVEDGVYTEGYEEYPPYVRIEKIPLYNDDSSSEEDSDSSSEEDSDSSSEEYDDDYYNEKDDDNDDDYKTE